MFAVSIVAVVHCLKLRRDWLFYLGVPADSPEAEAVEALGYNPRFEDDIKLLDLLIANLEARRRSAWTLALPLHADELGSQTAIYNCIVYALYEYDLELYRDFRSQGGSPSA